MNAKIRVTIWGSLVLAMATLVSSFPVQAQVSETPAHQRVSMSQQPQNYAVLHVDAAMGDDQSGSGSVDHPYKTITHALSRVSNDSTVILLAPGHYGQASGEQFPLELRPGITIQGSAGEARNTMIVGSGEFRDGGMSQNATILAADRSGLANIAISNPKGNGVWINSGTPVLRRVVLVSNAMAGVQVIDSAPVIENSYFNRNQLGLAIQGNGRAIIRGNYFEATGRAITVASPATPTINNNRIARNDVGIALKNNARPVLEANVLNGNGRNGVVEVDTTTMPVVAAAAAESAVTAQAESMTASRLDTAAVAIKASPSVVSTPLTVLPSAPVPEVPTQTVITAFVDTAPLADPAPLESPSIEVDAAENEIDEPVAVVRADVDDVRTALSVSSEEEDIEAEPVVYEDGETVASFRQHLAASVAAADERPPIVQRQQISLSNSVDDLPGEAAISFTNSPGDEAGIEIAVIPTHEASLDTNDNNGNGGRQGDISKLLSRLQRPAAAASAVPVSTPVPIPDSGSDVLSGGLPDQRLPVPSAAIPSSRGAGHLRPPGAVSVARVFRYQVLVDVVDAESLQVLVPDAFRTQVGSRTFMQAGAYVDEVEAQERLEWLRENGIEGRVNLRE